MFFPKKQAGVQSYFASNQAQDTIAAKQHGNVIKTPFMAYGSFATYVHPTQCYGIIFGASPKGMQMDIDRLMRAGVATDNDRTKLANFNASQGARQSANEHLVPEQLFDDPKTTEKEVEGISAVKALQIAQQQGQTIYTITKENYSQILPKLNLSSSVITDIRNAVNAGRVVTAHERNISYKGWSGSGYIIIDPTSGAGAYLIDGGANGGVVAAVNSQGQALTLYVALLGLISTFLAVSGIGWVLLPIVLTVLIRVVSYILIYATYMDMQNRNCKTSDNVGLVAAGIFYLELGFARSPLLQLLSLIHI